MKINECLDVLPIQGDVMGRLFLVHPSLLHDGKNIILADTGYPEQYAVFDAAFKEAGFLLNALTGLILTHQDLDHIGSFKEIAARAPHKIEVMAHEAEKPYIDGSDVPLKLAGLEVNLPSLPPAQLAFYDRLKLGYRYCCAPVDRALTDGEVLPFCGGITVIHTPGHTPGHISLYLNQYQVLIAGDALYVENGRLEYNDPIYNNNQQLYYESLKKLAAYDIKTVVSYHGGVSSEDVQQRLQELANRA